MSTDPERPSEECCADFRAKFDDWKARAEKSVREEPVKTAGLAFLAGIFLTVLPVGAILSMLFRLVAALIRPALIILGIVKIFEEYDRRK